MADKPNELELRDARLILAGAIAAAGKAESSVVWKGRVHALIPEVAAMFGERSNQISRAVSMLRATPFTAEFLGFDTEYLTSKGSPDKSKRVQVRLAHGIDKRHPDGVQRIRTERTDTQVGKRMLEKLQQVEPGQTLLCWKVQEEMRSGEGETVAILMHFEVLPDRKDSPTRSPSGGEGAGPLPPVARPEEEGPGTPTPGPTDFARAEMDAFNEATRHLPAKRKIALVRDLVAAKQWPPDVDNIDHLLLRARVEEDF